MRADNFKTIRKVLTAGVGQEILAANATKRRELKSVQITSDANTKVDFYFGASPNDLNALGCGDIPAFGGSNVMWNGNGPISAINQPLNIDIVGAANVRVYVTYQEE